MVAPLAPGTCWPCVHCGWTLHLPKTRFADGLRLEVIRMVTNGKGAIVVTGTSTGIGKACALHLDKLGFQVFAGIRREVDGQALKQQASERFTPIILDITDAVAISAAAEMVATAVGENGLTGLVNNAGIVAAGTLEILPITELRKQFEVNVIGQIAVTQALLALLRMGHGRVVNIGSLSGKVAIPLLGPYS